ncbi:molybdate ABC transporter substrate-binding protein [Shimia biformata]|uniref:molybdate ABC transporter substrate-binding protein n=1 Tax=Shimia biformata TaxID=1294299 RepID=UPI001EF1CB02|nr:molybdate ABC transporter substrate-binding protein [Shimia biformata]
MAGPVLADRISVFAAASLKNALDEIAAGYEADTGHDVVLTYAGSARLARQVQAGAPADIVFLASTDWMDELERAEVLVVDSRTDLLTNRLVLVGHEGKPLELSSDDLVARLGDGRLAVAMTNAVPAGIYAKQALTSLGLWPAVAGRLAETDNVRAALALVALGAAPLGAVYASDARAEPRVAILATFPEDTHGPIRYPVALVHDTDAARGFLDVLTGQSAEVFARHGFGLVEARE